MLTVSNRFLFLKPISYLKQQTSDAENVSG